MRYLNAPDTQLNDTLVITHTEEQDGAPDAALKTLSLPSSAVVVPFCSSINSLQTNSDLIDLSDKEVIFFINYLFKLLFVF